MDSDNKHFIIFHCLRVSGIEEGLSGVAVVQGLTCVCSQEAGGAGMVGGGAAGWSPLSLHSFQTSPCHLPMCIMMYSSSMPIFHCLVYLPIDWVSLWHGGFRTEAANTAAEDSRGKCPRPQLTRQCFCDRDSEVRQMPLLHSVGQE